MKKLNLPLMRSYLFTINNIAVISVLSIKETWVKRKNECFSINMSCFSDKFRLNLYSIIEK